MNDEQREKLRQSCLMLLANSNVKFATRKGQELAYAFWVGVVRGQEALGLAPSPHVVLCLMSGRIDELMKEPK